MVFSGGQMYHRKPVNNRDKPMKTNTAGSQRATRSARRAGTGGAREGARALRSVRRTQRAAGPMADKREPDLSHEEQELRIREQDLAAIEEILRTPMSTFATLGEYVDFLHDALKAAIAQARVDVERLREQYRFPAQPTGEPSDWQLEIWENVIDACIEEVPHA